MLPEILFTWLLGALFGSMLFFAVTVAPTVFQALDVNQGGVFLRRLFPRYYLWGIVLSSLCLLAVLMGKHDSWITACCTLILAGFLYARQVLMPRINSARDGDREGDPVAARRFRSLHLQSVVINALQLLLLLGVALAPAWR